MHAVFYDYIGDMCFVPDFLENRPCGELYLMDSRGCAQFEKVSGAQGSGSESALFWGEAGGMQGGFLHS